MKIREFQVGKGAPLLLISGLNVLENLEGALVCARGVQESALRHNINVVFKASFDKANRSSRQSFRGPGLDEGLRILDRVKAETGLAITTDIHEPGQAKLAAEIVDLLQIPSFLSRQTELIAAAAGTGLPVNIKKGQFMAPSDVAHAVDKATSYGASGVIVTERGTTFGYHDLVVDMRGLVAMQEYAPVCLDATHAVQHPGAGTLASSGDRSYVAPLARAAVALGVDALFIETHPEPDNAPCDGMCQIRLSDLDVVLEQVCAIRSALDESTA